MQEHTEAVGDKPGVFGRERGDLGTCKSLKAQVSRAVAELGLTRPPWRKRKRPTAPPFSGPSGGPLPA